MRTKLTLVSIVVRGQTFSTFVDLPVDENGKVHAPGNIYENFCRELGIRPDTCIGYY